MIAALLAFLSLPALTRAQAAPIAVPGTQVTLEPPQGFTLAERFPGFQRVDVNASILINELPAPVAEVQKAMTREGLATRGMLLLETHRVQHTGGEALLIKASQRQQGIDYLKWLLVTGDARATTLVVATFRSDTAAELEAPLREAVLSTTLNATGASDPFAGLLFRIEPGDKLKIAARMSNMLLLTETGEPRATAPDAPIYVVGSSFGGALRGDLAAYAQARAHKTVQIKDLRNLQGGALEIDGREAYELQADATDAKSGEPMRLYQVIVREQNGYVIAQGLVGTARAEAFLPEFRRVTQSLKWVRR